MSDKNNVNGVSVGPADNISENKLGAAAQKSKEQLELDKEFDTFLVTHIPEELEYPKPDIKISEMPEKNAKKSAKAVEKNNKKSLLSPNASFILSLTFKLFLICSAVAAMLAVVNAITAPIIAENQFAEKKAIIIDFFPNITEFETLESQNPNVSAIYLIKENGENVGYCADVISSGFSGDMNMIVGVDTSFNIKGIKIVSHAETPGFGTKVVEDAEYLKTYNDLGKKELVLGVDVDAMSGVTSTSTTLNKGVNTALSVFNEVFSEDAAAGATPEKGEDTVAGATPEKGEDTVAGATPEKGEDTVAGATPEKGEDTVAGATPEKSADTAAGATEATEKDSDTAPSTEKTAKSALTNELNALVGLYGWVSDLEEPILYTGDHPFEILIMLKAGGVDAGYVAITTITTELESMKILVGTWFNQVLGVRVLDYDGTSFEKLALDPDYIIDNYKNKSSFVYGTDIPEFDEASDEAQELSLIVANVLKYYPKHLEIAKNLTEAATNE